MTRWAEWQCEHQPAPLCISYVWKREAQYIYHSTKKNDTTLIENVRRFLSLSPRCRRRRCRRKDEPNGIENVPFSTLRENEEKKNNIASCLPGKCALA